MGCGVLLEQFRSKRDAFFRSAQVLYAAGKEDTPRMQRMQAQAGTGQPFKTLYRVAASELGGAIGGTASTAKNCWSSLKT